MTELTTLVKKHDRVQVGCCLVVRSPAPGQTEIIYVGTIHGSPDFESLGPGAMVYLHPEDVAVLQEFSERNLQ